ncbi:prepilin peptidase [Emcibacter sp.]|uniref:prepilin peptidase n=1 Tax=Emcibacter sp. TaxID=1979954 RepID=UPI003A8EED85
MALLGIVLLPPTLYIWGGVLFIPLVFLGLIDLKTYRLPDYLTLPLILAGVVPSYLELAGFPPILHSLAGAVSGYLFIFLVATAYRRLRGREGIGMGDAKLLAAGGAWVGILFLPFILLLASVAGLLVVFVTFRGSARLQTAIPFGPFLAAGIWLTWISAVSSLLVLAG